MTPEEAVWFREKISNIDPADVFPILDIGSGDINHREKKQPWISMDLLVPLAQKGQILYADRKRGDGIDINLDIEDDGSLQKLKSYDFKSILLSNVLEHVNNPGLVAKRLVNALPLRGYVFVSVPYQFPFHPDPVDNMLRPNINELEELFGGQELIKGEILTSYDYLGYLLSNPTNLLRSLVRLLVPFYKPSGWLSVVLHYLWLKRKFSATCVILKKK